MSTYKNYEHASLAELITRFQDKLTSDSETPLTYFSALAVRIAQHGSPGLAFLKSALADQDEERVIAAMIAAGKGPDAQWYQNQLEQLLNDPRARVVTEAIECLRPYDSPGLNEKIKRLLEHSSPNVVGVALVYLAVHSQQQALPLLLKALQHQSSTVRWHAIDGFDEIGLAEIGNEDVIESLRPLLKDPSASVRAKAAFTIEFLETGEYGEYANPSEK